MLCFPVAACWSQEVRRNSAVFPATSGVATTTAVEDGFPDKHASWCFPPEGRCAPAR